MGNSFDWRIKKIQIGLDTDDSLNGCYLNFILQINITLNDRGLKGAVY